MNSKLMSLNLRFGIKFDELGVHVKFPIVTPVS